MAIHSKRTGLRTGYTTGACAAAAVQAAAIALETGAAPDQVTIMLPAGFLATFKLASCDLSAEAATASVIKDAGDDPDITHGAEIIARVESFARGPLAKVVIEGGEGVGRVTRPGLGLAVGGPAINPIPTQMILEAASPTAGRLKIGLKVTISVPNGEKLARRTLNPRLGIAGGISILGTTGLVIPFSTDAYQATIKLALDIAVTTGCREIALCTGARSEKFARRVLDLPIEAFIQMGDFAGFSLEECVRHAISQVYLCGFIGKLSKIASGNFSTHVSRGQLSPDFLPSLARTAGVASPGMETLRQANTARHFLEMVTASDSANVAGLVCRSAQEKSEDLVAKKLRVDCLLFDFEGQLLARTDLP
ncbi:MAG: cobalt-precorrin-5B (C(1))-methyltransferase [Chloroflexi bacterium]|nr:cobalt-precorrin-5B (C(1))-methyltransferase [Chloroflexota bacterium]